MTPSTSSQSGRQSGSWQTIGQQPIMVAAVALFLVILGVGGIFAWRSYSGTTPEPERLTAARLTQARVAQASEQLVEKTKGIEVTQQQSIDQLQVVQDQLQTVQRLLASQQNETRKLSEQVGTLTSTLDNLRQSFASIPSPEAAAPSSVRERPRRSRSRATATKGRVKVVVQRKRSGSRS
jgi:septal ring factor EnvC (AmiA/AmiB activator)